MDQGPGVPAEALPRIFEPFFRAKTPGPSKAGFGLGLSVAQQIVTLHGGRIVARNRPEGGLEVEIELPPANQTGPSG
jgi:signal transduction histidine kinase